MLSKIFLIVSLFCLCSYLYGILNTITIVEENLCKMTYMYEYPQFVKIYFKQNERFPKYNLYAYSEGHLTEKTRNMEFTGAPVLFIPGNSGSHKQVRSLASVALRKGLDYNWGPHLDYFTVDLNEEYAALFGGVLEEQTEYISYCLTSILKLYEKQRNRPTTVLIVGHSMGGKIAQALLLSPDTAQKVNTIITLAAPMDIPVVAMDSYIAAFYRNVQESWLEHKDIIRSVANETNYCQNCQEISTIEEKDATTDENENETKWKDKLLITIGGGSRDLLIHSGLTDSIFSDIHAMTSSIPNVWLTTDHYCSVWCLQLVLVINRFLYSILKPIRGRDYSHGQQFHEEKSIRLSRAIHYFQSSTQSVNQKDANKEITMVTSSNNFGDWVEDSRRVFTEQFKNGLKTQRVQMIRLNNLPQYEILSVEVINLENSDWVFGCAVTDIVNYTRFCEKALSISHYATKLPSLRHARFALELNLYKIKQSYPDWTHVLLRILPTKEPVQLNIDVHSRGDRELKVIMPKWYSFSTVNILEDTILGSSFYEMKIYGMEDTHQSLEFSLKARSCSKPQYHSVAKLCVPWVNGFDRYHYFTETKTNPMYLYVPKSKPIGYNSSSNPVILQIHLDPNCRYKLNVKNSLGMTIAKIVQQYSFWLPAHLVAILMLAFKHQISVTPNKETFKCGSLHIALVKCTPFFIISASRLFVKFILWTKQLPTPDNYEHSIFVSVIIHGSALAILTLAAGAAWAGICFFGNAIYKMIFKLVQLPIPTISSLIVPVIEKFPLSVAVFLISMAMASCGAIALICACFVYFILLTKMYEDYLEEFVFKTAKMIATKLFGKWSKSSEKRDENQEGTVQETNATDETANFVDSKKHEENKEQEEIESIPNGNENRNETQKSDEVATKSSEDDNKKEEISDINAEETLTEEDIDKMLKETLDKHQKMDEERKKELALARAEYDSVHDGLSSINFHLTLFLLLLILTLINLPAAVTWAKNYHFSKILNPDPSFIPSIISLLSMAVLWQLPTPRNLYGYRTISSILYVTAVICILYCQDSLYRLNGVICTVFIFVTLHQIVAPKIQTHTQTNESDDKMRIEKFKDLLGTQ